MTCFFLFLSLGFAEEGFWPPQQLPNVKLSETFKETIPKLVDRSSTYIRSVVQLPNCSGTIASSQALILSNAHCLHEFIDSPNAFHATSQQDEKKINGFHVFLTTNVQDVTKKVLKGTREKTPPDYFAYRVKRNRNSLLRACRKSSTKNRCTIHYDSIQKRYQLITERQYDDVRVVHIPDPQKIHIDFAFVRIYEAGKPVDTPYFLRPKIVDPESNTNIFTVGYPQSSHRYFDMIEVEYLLKEEYPLLKSILGRLKSVLNSFLLIRLPYSKAHILYAMVQETTMNIKHFESLFSQDEVYTKNKKREQRFLEWIQQNPNRLRYNKAIQKRKELLQKYHQNKKTLTQLQWLNLSSDLFSSAQMRIGWRKNRSLSKEERKDGYQNRDKEKMIVHLSEFPKHLDIQLEKALFLAFAEKKSIPPIDDFIQRYNDPTEAFSFLESETSILLDVKESILCLNPKRELPNSIWFALGQKSHRLETQALEKQADLQKRIQTQENIIKEGLYRSDQSTIYPDADSSLRISFGSTQKIWSVDLFTLDVHNAPHTSFVQTQLGWFPYFVSNIDATHGSSGAPTFNTAGEWIGVLFNGNNTRLTSSWFYTKTQQNYHLSMKSILWYLSLQEHRKNLVSEIQPLHQRSRHNKDAMKP